MKLADLTWLGQRLVDAGRLESQAHARGVPTAEFVVMNSLLEDSPSTITALTRRTGYAQSRVSTAVVGLADRGWVEVQTDATDRRRTLVSVVDRIRGVVDDIQAGSDTRTLELMLESLSERRRDEIIGALEELHHLLRERAESEKQSHEASESIERPSS